MRLERIEVEGFRGIDRSSVSLDHLTTLIGEPDCGKSSLLHAVARVLDPFHPDRPPHFSVLDFHATDGDTGRRAARLSVTIGLLSEAASLEDVPVALGQDERVTLRVVSQRHGDGEPTTIVEVVGAHGRARADESGARLLNWLRRRHPAIIVRGPRPSVAEGAPETAASDRLRARLSEPSGPGSPWTGGQVETVRAELLHVAARLADQLGPPPARHRSVLAMTDTPRALITDLSRALEPDAGRQRRAGALWLLVAILDAIPAGGLADGADPVLLLDDPEANLHPTWLAALAAVALNLPFQQIVATHSPEVLTWVPLTSLRRLARSRGGIEVRSIHTERYSGSELRRLTFHVRLNRGAALFARCWVLVEGETEAWLVPELARIVGVEFPVEGIRVIEFAQAGIEPLVKLADDLDIPWLVLADGDSAGREYARAAREYSAAGGTASRSVFLLPTTDIEHYLYDTGFADVIREQAGRHTGRENVIIREAVDRASKPGLALEVLAAADERGADAVPPILRELAERARRAAMGET
jgi:putative ATP-dependent endonuclease of OLD family